jgi:hypothetical protein
MKRRIPKIQPFRISFLKTTTRLNSHFLKLIDDLFHRHLIPLRTWHSAFQPIISQIRNVVSDSHRIEWIHGALD